MILEWLKIDTNNANQDYLFTVLHFTEICNPTEEITNYLKQEILKSYRQLEFYKLHYANEPKEKLEEYISKYVIPSDTEQVNRNVRQGDWGEIITALIAINFNNLLVPIHKLRWKFNKDRSVFCTDMIAHNPGDNIDNIYYYEIKTRLTPDRKEGGKYISVIAHDSLLKDENSSTECIADFLSRYYYEIQDYDSAKKYNDIVKAPDNYNRHFEIVLIVNKDNYLENILSGLNDLPPILEPLNITVICIDNLRDVINNTWTNICKEAIKLVYE